MNKKLLFTVAILLLTFIGKAQTTYLVIDKDIRLPKDSITYSSLIRDLDSFLLAAQKNSGENQWVLPKEKAETQTLLDEIQGMEKSDSIEFKPHLINVEALSDKKSFLVQVAYMGISDTQPLLRACFELIAHRTENGFLFSSPLKRNTKDWKTKTVEHFTFHYQDTTAENIIKQYVKYLTEYDKMLNINKMTEFYFCDDCESMAQTLQLAGIQYKLDYNSFSWPGISFVTDEKIIAIQTQQQSRRKVLDPHDFFHGRVSVAIPIGQNHFMVCGCAYLYCGSWGISWEGIQKLFKTRMVYDKKTDWLKLYFEKYNFGESKEEHLLIPQFVNALIIQKAEKEQGFSTVMKLLASGDMYKDRENFFKTLETIAGINEKNFNKKVGKLIDDAMKNR